MDGPQRILGTERRLTKGKKAKEMATGYLQKGALQVIPVLSSLKKTSVPGSGKPTGAEDDKATIKHKRKLIMISSKEGGNLHWQLDDDFAWILVPKSM